MSAHFVMLWSDWLIWALVFAMGLAGFWMRRQPQLLEPWRHVLRSQMAMVSLIVLLFFVGTGLLDSIHLQVSRLQVSTGQPMLQVKSVLDLLVGPLGEQDEKTYSAPFATHLFAQASDGYSVLKFVDTRHALTWLVLKGIFWGLLASFALIAGVLLILARCRGESIARCCAAVWYRKTPSAWRSGLTTLMMMIVLIAVLVQLAAHYHIFGTDKVGRDVFYETIKSIRTGMMIGTLTTLFMLPFALLLGTAAGYFGGWVDDVIQYLYTTLSSIPGVLLISAAVLVLQVYIANHPQLFPTLIQRADARLLALCLILGLTSWAGLCRLLRGETLKLRQQEYVQAARALGVSRWKTILRHIMPNVMHIVLITLVLDFSGLVLAEAVLSYVGVGVDPTTMSWGNMINSSRLELAREPMVWWPLLAALLFMFVFVLCANIFADKVRDAFDPTLRNVS